MSSIEKLKADQQALMQAMKLLQQACNTLAPALRAEDAYKLQEATNEVSQDLTDAATRLYARRGWSWPGCWAIGRRWSLGRSMRM
jgi:hypothetical protein